MKTTKHISRTGWITVLSLIFYALSISSIAAQDATTNQIINNARNRDRHPQGDRGYYGLYLKDQLMGLPQKKPRYESAADSLEKRNEFMRLCGIAFEAYEAKDALKTVVYGDSALRTGFDNQQIFFYMADSYEQLGDDERALQFYREVKNHGTPGGSEALTAFKKRMKARKKLARKK